MDDVNSLQDALGEIISTDYARKRATCAQTAHAASLSPLPRFSQKERAVTFADGIATYKVYAHVNQNPREIDTLISGAGFSPGEAQNYRNRHGFSSNDKGTFLSALAEARTGFLGLTQQEYLSLQSAMIPQGVSEKTKERVAALRQYIHRMPYADFMVEVRAYLQSLQIEFSQDVARPVSVAAAFVSPVPVVSDTRSQGKILQESIKQAEAAVASTAAALEEGERALVSAKWAQQEAARAIAQAKEAAAGVAA